MTTDETQRETDCVGFADCPCGKCRAQRLAATESHPHHAHLSDRSYCGACRTQTILANYASPRG